LCATDCAIPPKDFLGKIYTDSLVHSRPALDLLIAVIGKDRIILGSDYPFPLGELDVGRLIEASDYDQELKVNLINCSNFFCTKD
jgi:aminocarboxymuconate-semialdehyde decarboxylase